MIGRKVSEITCEIGIRIPGHVVTTLSLQRNNADMEICDFGVRCRLQGKELLLPFAAINQIELMPEVKEVAKTAEKLIDAAPASDSPRRILKKKT